MSQSFTRGFCDHTANAANRRASAWMKLGLALLESNVSARLREALVHFDRAIELRQSLPLDGDPLFRYGLAASWMNRGEVLTRLGSPGDLMQAIQAYDAALEALQGLPLEGNPLFRRRLAIAWQNRGLVLQAQGLGSKAGQSFEQATALLQHAHATAISDRDQLLATVYVNRARTLAKNHAWMPARSAAREALALAATDEIRNLAMAVAGLNARHLLCQAVTALLEDKSPGNLSKDQLADEALDAADDGLALARSWANRDHGRLRPLALELFRFGARAHQIFYPSFLGEFLLENLDPARSPDAFADDVAMQTAARESLWDAVRGSWRSESSRPAAQWETLTERLDELRAIDRRLAELRQSTPAPGSFTRPFFPASLAME